MSEQTPTTAPVNAPGAATVPVTARAGADVDTGSAGRLAWGARSDVGLVREHNEDAFLVHAPLFCVCDGMGGHAAGEVASAISVRCIAEHAPATADDVLLGAAVELANAAIIDGAAKGVGRPGMGCTATAAVIENDRMAVAHVGDSRLYVLHAGSLVRVTHDHSFVEELVDAGEITADEARVHPSRSVITRALGSDPDMYADHFTLDVSRGDRLILCSDGLSSMVPDSAIEDLAVSAATPQQAADTLVAEALAAGGHDNVTVIVVDVRDDGASELRRRRRRRSVIAWVAGLVTLAVASAIVALLYVSNSWYVGVNNGNVAIYQGVKGEFLGMPLSTLEETTTVRAEDLPEATQSSLEQGIGVASLEDAQSTVRSYRDQITEEKARAAEVADSTKSQGAQADSQAVARAGGEARPAKGGERP